METTMYDLKTTNPAMGRYEQEVLRNDLWKRPQLSVRDRSILTVAVLIARNQSAEMTNHFELALENGVTPTELSEIITHLSFYSGWANGTLAASVASDVFAKRGVTVDQLPGAIVEFLAIDEEIEASRVAIVDQTVGPIFQGLMDFTTNVLFRDLWLRPGLAPRDRSLATVAALVATSHFPQVSFHLNKAMENGTTETEAAEAITHLAFYAGWPNAMSSVAVAKAVFEKRRTPTS
ncbi:4-carboxymuconolactone decarboxylase [Pararhizobium polonicum]|uniref:4-carboxymuconolactone decarboxylase n=2 Tax=Pararhizobium polonicum TaxID=1612624 RepID=A0A1C7NX86_9HYPH|nr:4-carboxymuconolactone decarboxylase [Pararhizobium polonicum]